MVKIKMMGSPEEVHQQAKATKVTASAEAELLVIDDFDMDFAVDSEWLKSQKDIVRRLERAVAKTDIWFMNPRRPGKSLCVLDLDHTLLDFSKRTESSTNESFKRPFMYDFLTKVYSKYDIAIWSQTHWSWLEIKLTELGFINHPDFKVCFVLDKTAMFKVKAKEPIKRKGKVRYIDHLFA